MTWATKCLCTVNSISCLKVHLAKIHTKTQLGHDREIAPLTFTCQHCEFSEPGPEADFLKHLLSRHLSKNEKIQCPYKHCKFQSSVYATFNAHLSKKHNGHDWKMLKPEIVSGQSDENESEGQEQISFDGVLLQNTFKEKTNKQKRFLSLFIIS